MSRWNAMSGVWRGPEAVKNRMLVVGTPKLLPYAK
jgi:hypothetical protein